ncbi:hypothetical protein PMAA_021900 [Talaromyces marneffei ATCC 18224]|uniref:Uncharacterized protein n=1 Tax=Talaromyces marneffei (strain ATCC 18224 / CBS 334.59 / QM 7333) TaxID=441960 RepID=B6Q4P4_TALMQ|nr:hypothetical protein PMAA_021900 [Talaromyces marneffei ATCC 18224]
MASRVPTMEYMGHPGFNPSTKVGKDPVVICCRASNEIRQPKTPIDKRALLKRNNGSVAYCVTDGFLH